MIIRLTCLLCASLYGAMMIFGTEQPDAATAHVEVPEPVVSRSDVSSTAAPLSMAAIASDAPLVQPASFTPDQPAVVAPVVSASTFIPAAVRTAEVAEQSGLLRISALDAPAAVLHARGTEVVEINGRIVNLRAGPSTMTEVVARLKRGERAEVLEGSGNGWMRIRELSSGAEGFMSADFLSPVTPG